MDNKTKEIVKEIFSPILKDYFEISPRNIDWSSITNAFLFYEKDAKLVYTEIYKLEPKDPEILITQLSELYDVFANQMAEHFVLDSSNSDYEILNNETNSIFKEKVDFFNVLKNVTTKVERSRIINKLPNLAEHNDFSISDNDIENAIKKKSREDLKNKFNKWDKELSESEIPVYTLHEEEKLYSKNITLEKDNYTKKNKKTISRSWLKYAAVAAILITSLLIVQPTKTSNEKLFSQYSTIATNYRQLNYERLTRTSEGEENRSFYEFTLKNLSSAETDIALQGLKYFHEGNFDQSKKLLASINPKNKNSKILLFLAISQLNTNEVDIAITTLLYLENIPDFQFNDTVTFYLAISYLKKNNLKKAKTLLQSLTDKESLYHNQAQEIIKKMRWF
ncbi:hypothetical protein [Maribacter sp.]|uniref:hypothetical protein n=1 Tax=Maribacter sp. TaxID=1897614 RepID=UPI003297FF10